MKLLEDLEREVKNKRIPLNNKNRIYLTSVRGEDYIVKFHEKEETKRVNDALSLQEIAHKQDFPCNFPLKNDFGTFTKEYMGGIITAYNYLKGQQLDSKILWVNKVLDFAKLFSEFQEKYDGPKITYSRKGIHELIKDPVLGKNSLSEFQKDYLIDLSKFDKEICGGDSIIHGDILPKNIIQSLERKLNLIDFEKIMSGNLVGEIASSIFYSYLGTNLDLKKVYDSFSENIQEKMDLNLLDLKTAIAHKSAEYLVHRKINSNLGISKTREAIKAEGFFLQAIKLLEN